MIRWTLTALILCVKCFHGVDWDIYKRVKMPLVVDVWINAYFQAAFSCSFQSNHRLLKSITRGCWAKWRCTSESPITEVCVLCVYEVSAIVSVYVFLCIPIHRCMWLTVALYTAVVLVQSLTVDVIHFIQSVSRQIHHSCRNPVLNCVHTKSEFKGGVSSICKHNSCL